MHIIDWAIVAGLFAILVGSAISTKKYTKSVASFLAADRLGGRYLISIATTMAMFGVITFVYYFEQNYQVGFTPYWWGFIEGPVMIVMALSGWVIYRYRETRAMTLAQFFEMRYSKSFRIFSGIIAFVAGILNFGIFPSVGARFFIYLCGLPESILFLGLTLSTFHLIMIFLIFISILFTFLGGQIAIMITDFIQGTFSNIVFIIIIAFILLSFNWDQISSVMLNTPAENSLVHPFHIGKESHFNFWFYVISVFIAFYGPLLWQGTSGYNCSAKNAHEAKMAGILSGWRYRVFLHIAIILPLAARVLLNHPDFSNFAANVNGIINAIGEPALQNQVRIPLVIGQFLPIGLLGLLCAAMLAAFISTHDTYLHSWGSIFIQDVIMPFREKPLTPKQHIRVLRLSMIGVAIFIYIFSVFFRHTQYIIMYCQQSASVFFGGAGAAVIGGLYWKRGTTAGAWSGMITGMSLAIGGIIIKKISPDFFLTGQEISFWTAAISIMVYIVVSIVTCREPYNLDKLLHRGKYKIEDDVQAQLKQKKTFLEKLGFSHEFTKRDKIETLLTLSFPLFFTIVFIIGTIYNIMFEVTSQAWLTFWHYWTWTIYILMILVTIWFTVGGYLDIRYLFNKLKQTKVNPKDDGRVE